MRIDDADDLGQLIRRQRQAQRLSQGALAAQVGVSRQWLVEVEKGKPRAEIGLVLRTLWALGIKLDAEARGRAPAARTGRPSRVPAASPARSFLGSDFSELFDLDAQIDRARGRAR